MSNPSDMTIAARVSAELFFRLEREAARKGVKVGDYAGQILSGQHQNRVASQAPSCEDVRLMIREEIRAALGEMWRTPADGSHTMSISDPRLIVMPGWYTER